MVQRCNRGGHRIEASEKWREKTVGGGKYSLGSDDTAER